MSDLKDAPSRSKEIARRLIEGKAPYFATLYYEEANLVVDQCLHLGAEVHAKKTPLGGIKIRVPNEEELTEW